MNGAMKRIQDLSGDSTADEIRLSDGVVRFVFADHDSDCSDLVEINTDVAIIPAVLAPIHPVLPKLIEIAEFLPVAADSGRYMAPTGFGDMMNATRQGAHLALGRRRSDWRYVFQLVGTTNSLVCLVANVESIRISIKSVH